MSGGWSERLGLGTLLLLLASAAPPPATAADQALIAKGEYLARAGDCISCHTAKDGQPFAGGRMLPTPFGPISTPNLTPDPETGLGNWSDDDFYRAMHEGIDKEGNNLYPVFPYPSFTKISRDDVLAIRAYLASLPPVHAPRPPSGLSFPFNIRQGLDVWRALFFEAGAFTPDPKQSDEVDRGAYLVQGLGHCGGCHTPRNLLQGPKEGQALQGGVVPAQGWYAPDISADPRDGLGDWTVEQIATYFKTGVAKDKGIAVGPMAEVIHDSLSHLTDADRHAIAAYLKATPASTGSEPEREAEAANAAPTRSGAEVYLSHCAFCHQRDGRGIEGAVPALAGNGLVNAAGPQDVIKVVLGGLPATGGYAPMPGLGADLSPAEIAAAANYVRTAWGNEAAANAAPGQVAELAKEVPTALSGSGAACPPIGSEAVDQTGGLVPAITDPANGIVPLLQDITQANLLDQVDAVVGKLEAAHLDGSKAQQLNALAIAYCPIVAEAPGLDLAQKRWQLHRFAQLAYGRLNGTEAMTPKG